MVPVVTSALAGLGGQALSPLLGAGAKKLAEVFDPEARAYQQQLRADTAAMRQGKLGLSDAEKRSMLGETQRGLQAQTAGVEANLRRQAAATGGFGRSGAQTRALTQMVAGQQEKMAQAAGQVDALSQQKAQARYADVMSRLAAQRAEARQTAAQIGGAAAAAIQEGVGAYPTIKKAYLEKNLVDTLDKLELARKSGSQADIAAATAAHDKARAAAGGK
jgi:uncharacterized protein YdiU (UPF0061 family)